MPSLTRRLVVLLTALALLLGLAGGAAPAALAAKPQPKAPSTVLRGIDIDASTIPQLQRLMDRHKLTAVQLTQFYLHRIQKLEPRLNAVIAISPKAVADAQAADKARRRGSHLPLLGIPILLKDNIDTRGIPTTAGSWALAGSTPGDAFIVQRLRAAGAIVLGKLNLSEWANFRSIPSSSGWSGIGGQTNMPYVLDRNPCGSSSGSGVAAAADLATITIGTETDGSIVCPSGNNGVVGIKPTLGLWSRAGIVPISADQDTAGPITRNVTDAAVLLGALTGVDPVDGATAAQAGHAFTDYTQFLDADALAGARIGVWHAYDPAVGDAATIAQFEAAVDRLSALGATVVDPVSLDLSTDVFDAEFAALLCEFKTHVGAYLQT
jgi:amidase